MLGDARVHRWSPGIFESRLGWFNEAIAGPWRVMGPMGPRNSSKPLLSPGLIASMSLPLASGAAPWTLFDAHDTAATVPDPLLRLRFTAKTHLHDCGVAIAAAAHRLQTRRVAQQQAEHALRRRAITKK